MLDKLFDIGNSIILTANSLSYWICLFIAIICILLGLAGSEKAKSGATISVVVYAIIQCFLKVLI